MKKKTLIMIGASLIFVVMLVIIIQQQMNINKMESANAYFELGYKCESDGFIFEKSGVCKCNGDSITSQLYEYAPEYYEIKCLDISM